MRFSLAVTVVLVGISVKVWRNKAIHFKVKHSAPEKASKPSAPMGKTTGPDNGFRCQRQALASPGASDRQDHRAICGKKDGTRAQAGKR